MAKRRISMFEAFGATSPKGSPKGSGGPPVPQRSETQRAIDAQRGLDPREPRVPSSEVLRALHTQFEAELAAARRAPRVESGTTVGAAAVRGTSALAGACSPQGAADEGDVRSEHGAATASPTQAAQPTAYAQRSWPAEDEPRAPESGFVLPFGWVTFIVVQVGLFAVAFGLGALTAGGRAVSTADGTDLSLGEAAREAPGEFPGNSRAAPTDAAQPTRPAADPDGVRGARPAPKAAGNSRSAAGGGGSDDPDLAAFLDPQNLFSLQVASYDGSPNGQGMARHWQAFLRERQFPAVLRQVGTRLGLFVGASSNSLAIEELQQRLVELRDERGARIFTAPRVVNLKDYR